MTFAVKFPALLDEIANPADAAYIPRPDWYFLSLQVEIPLLVGDERDRYQRTDSSSLERLMLTPPANCGAQPT